MKTGRTSGQVFGFRERLLCSLRNNLRWPLLLNIDDFFFLVIDFDLLGSHKNNIWAADFFGLATQEFVIRRLSFLFSFRLRDISSFLVQWFGFLCWLS